MSRTLELLKKSINEKGELHLDACKTVIILSWLEKQVKDLEKQDQIIQEVCDLMKPLLMNHESKVFEQHYAREIELMENGDLV